MSDIPPRPELKLEELSAHNVTLVRDRLLSASSFEEQIEVESYLDTLWSIADTELRDQRRHGDRHAGVDLTEIHDLLQLAHDSAAVDKVQAAATALAEAAHCLSTSGRGLSARTDGLSASSDGRLR